MEDTVKKPTKKNKVHDWSNVVKQRRAIEAERGVTLARLRSKFLGLTQQQVAVKAKMTQSEISKLERRDDHMVSTLREYIQALGGELQIVVGFDDGEAIRLL